MNRDEIKSRARLSDSAADKLSRIESVLPLMADLAGADLFIDCMQEPDGRMFVAAQAGPGHMPSAYRSRVGRMSRLFTALWRRNHRCAISGQ